MLSQVLLNTELLHLFAWKPIKHNYKRSPATVPAVSA